MMKRKTLQLLTGALLCQPLSAGELQAQEQDKERPNTGSVCKERQYQTPCR